MICKQKYDWQERVILLVEDDAEAQLFFKAIFRATLVKIVTVSSGEQAIEEVKNTAEIDLILMDIRLPGIDGIEASRHIKEIRPEIPIVVQTAYALGNERQQAINAGCSDYVTKPIQVDTLFQKIEDIFMSI